MQAGTSRERRWPVLVDAEVRLDGGWLPARLHNISAHGLMIASKASISRGSYVEVRAKGICAVGRVVWKRGQYSGIRTQDANDLIPVLGFGGSGEAEAGARRREAVAEAKSTGTLELVVGRFRTVVFAIVLIAAAASLGYGVSRMLSAPLDEARQALAPR